MPGAIDRLGHGRKAVVAQDEKAMTATTIQMQASTGRTPKMS